MSDLMEAQEQTADILTHTPPTPQTTDQSCAAHRVHYRLTETAARVEEYCLLFISAKYK